MGDFVMDLLVEASLSTSMVKWLSCLPSKQAARVRFPFDVFYAPRFFLALAYKQTWLMMTDHTINNHLSQDVFVC